MHDLLGISAEILWIVRPRTMLIALQAISVHEVLLLL
jgi:hypothetical protein